MFNLISLVVSFIEFSSLKLLIIVSMFMSKENRGIHDLIAGTKVIDLKAKDENVFDGEIVK